MGENTRIAWTNHTFNPWEGCQRVGPGCDHCYAESRDVRFTGGTLWGPRAARRVMSDGNWAKPFSWDKKAGNDDNNNLVFCGSLCDWADNKAPDGQRDRLWSVIRSTANLRWQLLTKRAGNIQRYLPDDWDNGYQNVWLGVTVENKKHGIPRIDILRDIPAVVRFLSVEPLLEDLGDVDLRGIHWVIVGGESGNDHRTMERSWVISLREQCADNGVPFFFKQWGGRGGDKGGCLIDLFEHKEFPHGQ